MHCVFIPVILISCLTITLHSDSAIVQSVCVEYGEE